MAEYHFSKMRGYTLSTPGIKIVEEKYNAKFVGPFCVKDKHGSWTDMAVDVFYQSNPDTSKGHSEYFGIYENVIDGKIYICDAKSAFSEPITGIVADNGEVVMSHWRHDSRRSMDGSVEIDGGRDYVRLIGEKSIAAKKVKVGCKNGELYIMDNNDA